MTDQTPPADPWRFIEKHDPGCHIFDWQHVCSCGCDAVAKAVADLRSHLSARDDELQELREFRALNIDKYYIWLTSCDRLCKLAIANAALSIREEQIKELTEQNKAEREWRCQTDDTNVYLKRQLSNAQSSLARLEQEKEALRVLAKEATNGWGCRANSKREHAEIARLHTAIDAFAAHLSSGDPT